MICNRAQPFNDKQVMANIDKFIKTSGGLQIGSNKHLDYQLWLQSKITKQSYFSMLMESLLK
jgi:hypothetical protein